MNEYLVLICWWSGIGENGRDEWELPRAYHATAKTQEEAKEEVRNHLLKRWMPNAFKVFGVKPDPNVCQEPNCEKVDGECKKCPVKIVC